MVDINSTFWTENGRNLQKPDLVCLKQNHNLYKTLLMQLVGKIEFDTDGIRLADRDMGNAKFQNFVEIAIAENIDLAITPEYSCPWSCVENLLINNRFPTERKIWIIGCQSVKPRELKSIIDNNQNVIWVYDDNLLTQNINENKFFDPVCIFFKTKDANNTVKDVIINTKVGCLKRIFK